MKRIFEAFMAIGFLILLIPSIVFFSKGKVDKAKSQNSPQNNLSQEIDFENQASDEKSQKANNFYSVLDHKTKKLLKLSPTEYIKGVVAAEMPCSYETEALKAQCICAHTYALVQLEQYGYTLSTDPSVCQGYMPQSERKKFWGNRFNEYENKLTMAVDEVINEAITVDGKPILAAFHAISGGKTEAAKNVWQRDIPYLAPVESVSDKKAPDYKTQKSFSSAEISNALLKEFPKIKLDKDEAKWFKKIKRSQSGNVISITIGNTETTGNKLRELLALRSADFDIAYKNHSFVFTVYGYGHFVGMSQYGANEMAKSGCSYEDILLHYYSGAAITQL